MRWPSSFQKKGGWVYALKKEAQGKGKGEFGQLVGDTLGREENQWTAEKKKQGTGKGKDF